MSDKTPLEAEATAETTTFEFFDQSWTVPTKRHLSHIKKMRDELRAGVHDYNLLVAETMLGAKQFDALCEVDPDEDQLNEFVDALAKTMGLGNSGNS